MTKRFTPAITAAIVIAVVALASVSIGAQTSPKAAVKAPPKNYTPAKTPWGDPDLQGIYTNKDENGIPFERPSQFEGKKIEDLVPLPDGSLYCGARRQPVVKPAPVRSTGTSTTARRTAGHGSSSIHPTERSRRPPPRRRSGRTRARPPGAAAVRRIPMRTAACTTSALPAGFPAR